MCKSVYILTGIILIGITKNRSSFAQSYNTYPLSVGNRWEYVDECVPPQYQKARPFGVVKDTLMSNGKSYAQIQGSWIEYQRFEDRRVFFYDSKSETEYLLFDFNATPGTMIATHIRGNDTTDINNGSFTSN